MQWRWRHKDRVLWLRFGDGSEAIVSSISTEVLAPGSDAAEFVQNWKEHDGSAAEPDPDNDFGF